MKLNLSPAINIICIIVISFVFGIGAVTAPFFILYLCGVAISVLSTKGVLLIAVISVMLSVLSLHMYFNHN